MTEGKKTFTSHLNHFNDKDKYKITMNNKHLIVKVITLLYQEYEQETPSEISKDICSRIMECIKLPEVTTGLDTERNILVSLNRTVTNLLKDLGKEELSKTQLKQQLIVDCSEDTVLKDAIEVGLLDDLTEQERTKYIHSIRRELQSYLREQDAIAIVKDAYTKLVYGGEEVGDKLEEVKLLAGKLEDFTSGQISEDPGVVISFTLDEEEKLEAVFHEIKNRSEGVGGYRFGFKLINKMVGGTMESGKLVSLGALQHQHKTGTSLALFRQILMYNIPLITDFVEDEGKTKEEIDQEDRDYVYNEEDWVLYDDPYFMRKVPVIALKHPFKGKTPKRKPLAIRISSEDEMTDNIQQIFNNIYFNVEKVAPDINNFTERQMIDYVKFHLQRNGWSVLFERINPSEWTYRSVIQKVLDQEARGYEVKVFMIDYLGMIPTRGCEEGPAGHALRDMFRRVRNFMSAWKFQAINSVMG